MVDVSFILVLAGWQSSAHVYHVHLSQIMITFKAVMFVDPYLSVALIWGGYHDFSPPYSFSFFMCFGERVLWHNALPNLKNIFLSFLSGLI